MPGRSKRLVTCNNVLKFVANSPVNTRNRHFIVSKPYRNEPQGHSASVSKHILGYCSNARIATNRHTKNAEVNIPRKRASR